MIAPSFATGKKALPHAILESQRNMEDEVRELRGRIESLEHELNQLKFKSDQKPALSSDNLPNAVDPIASPGGDVKPPLGKAHDRPTDGTQYLQAPAPGDDANSSVEDTFNQARTLITQRQYESASKLLQQVVEAHPRSTAAIDAHYWLGEIAFINGDIESAAVSFGQSYETYEKIKEKSPTAKISKAANSLIQLARCLNKMGQMQKAITTLNQLHKAFPNHPKKIVSLMAQRARKEIEDRRFHKSRL